MCLKILLENREEFNVENDKNSFSVKKDIKKDIKVYRSFGNGSEKSYHIISGHYRKCIQKDESIKSVWVKST